MGDDFLLGAMTTHSLVSTPHNLQAPTNLQTSPRIVGHQVTSRIRRRVFSRPWCCTGVLRWKCCMVLWTRDDELDLVVVLVLLDLPIQQSVLVLHVYPVGRWCGRRDSTSLQSVVITLRAGEFLSGEGKVGEYGSKVWPD